MLGFDALGPLQLQGPEGLLDTRELWGGGVGQAVGVADEPCHVGAVVDPQLKPHGSWWHGHSRSRVTSGESRRVGRPGG
jgi:hypothetical protein